MLSLVKHIFQNVLSILFVFFSVCSVARWLNSYKKIKKNVSDYQPPKYFSYQRSSRLFCARCVFKKTNWLILF